MQGIGFSRLAFFATVSRYERGYGDRFLTDRTTIVSGTGFAVGTFTSKTHRAFAGLVVDEKVLEIHAALAMPEHVTLFDLLQDWQANFVALEAAASKFRDGNESLRRLAIPLSDVRPLAPVGFPRQILCAGAN